jgi:hypothetical protein
VLADPARLAELAIRFSDCPSKAQGGDLGLVERGSTVPEFERQLDAIPPGEVCPTVVRSRYGMNVVRVLERAPGRVPPLAAVRDRIAQFLHEASWRQAVQGYIAALAARALIEHFDLFEGENAPPRPAAWPAGSSCTGADLPALGWVEEKPDITMPELADRLHREHDVTATPSALSRLLCRAGWTYKKPSPRRSSSAPTSRSGADAGFGG